MDVSQKTGSGLFSTSSIRFLSVPFLYKKSCFEYISMHIYYKELLPRCIHTGSMRHRSSAAVIPSHAGAPPKFPLLFFPSSGPAYLHISSRIVPLFHIHIDPKKGLTVITRLSLFPAHVRPPAARLVPAHIHHGHARESSARLYPA